MKINAQRALVTGATGFIGGHIANQLLKLGWSVKLLVREPERLMPSLRQCDLVQGDLLNQKSLLTAVSDVDVLFHCAANVRTWDTWDAYYETNVVGIQNILNAINRVNLKLSRLLHFSSMDVYGFPNEPCDEQSPATGGSFGYGRSKLLGELLIKKHCSAYNIPYTIFRPSNVIGPGSQFISRIGESLRSGLMLKINSGANNAGLLYIDSLVEYALWAVQNNISIGQCYNVNDCYSVTWAEFLRIFKTNINSHGITFNLSFVLANQLARISEQFYRVFFPSKEPLLHRLLVVIFGKTCGHSASKIRNDSNITSTISFDEAMMRSISWFLEQERTTHV